MALWNLGIIDSGDGLAPILCQAIIWINIYKLSVELCKIIVLLNLNSNIYWFFLFFFNKKIILCYSANICLNYSQKSKIKIR